MVAVTEEKTVFAIAPEGTGDGVPLVLLGIPAGAWEYMRDGKTHSFDLSKAGVPVKLMLFGAADHAAAMAVINELMGRQNTLYLDARREDFSIKPRSP